MMLTLLLQRLNLSSIGTYGVLMKVTDAGSVPFLVTCEDPWNNNEDFKSCIPAGVYTCKKSYYNAGKYWTFEITGVPDRDNIKIHIANDKEDVAGCLGVGLEFRFPMIGIARSTEGFARFWDLVKDFSEFQLVIKNPV